MSDAESKDLCISCRNQFDCMGQGVFGTEECTEWDPVNSATAQPAIPAETADVPSRGGPRKSPVQGGCKP
jgi:hypothetical protein